MMKRFLLFLLLLGSNRIFAKVRLRSFCQKQRLTLVYHLNERWISLSKGKKRIKLFLELPYMVFGNDFYALDNVPTVGPKGDLWLSDTTAKRLLSLINTKSSVFSKKAVVSSSSSISSSSSVSSFFSKSSSRFSSSSSSIKKSSFSSARTDFRPINAVVIDPGHGGKDPGGLGIHGEKEKEIVLSVAKRVYAKFKKEPKIRAVLTRNKDVFVTLEGRTLKTSEMMRRYNPIFVSIHANISFNPKVKGIEIYHFGDRASNDNDRYLENLENKGFDKHDIKKTEALFVILSDLIRDGVVAESKSLGRYLMRTMVRSTGAKNRKVRQANFYVLKYNPVTSVLLEIGFLSNKEELKKLMTSAYREKMAEGIYQGIKNFIDDYNRKKGEI